MVLLYTFNNYTYSGENNIHNIGLRIPESFSCAGLCLSGHLSEAGVQQVGKWVKAGSPCLFYQAFYVWSFHTQPRPDQTSCLDHYLPHRGVGGHLPLVAGHCEWEHFQQGSVPCTRQCSWLSSGSSLLPTDELFIIILLHLTVPNCHQEACSTLGNLNCFPYLLLFSLHSFILNPS